tara:strand:+ start:910 stop:1167 length:258 start_codon:yes stop_codon:yes gene_type:complete
VQIKRVNESGLRDIYCTRQRNILPQKGSENYRPDEKLNNIMTNGMILVWTPDITLGERKNRESGWLKIKTNQILNYNFIGEIPSA